jgi:hypothetical protein
MVQRYEHPDGMPPEGASHPITAGDHWRRNGDIIESITDPSKIRGIFEKDCGAIERIANRDGVPVEIVARRYGYDA